jgi:DNA topoisomerase-3
MRLFVAEKPSLARAIADVLPGPKVRRDGHIACGSDDIVTWCAGHILELAPPDAYDPAYKRWRLEHLPIVPNDWKLIASAPELLRNIRGLLPRADRVVHAGDPDREGQLLIDEVLEFLGYRGPVDRLLISDLTPASVQRALSEVQPNERYRGLYESGLARQRADWLYGLNLTRLYTLLGRAGGYDGILSVGRVQTPVLGLVVRRDREIEAFAPRAYYVVRSVVSGSGGAFAATWQPQAATGARLDEAGRLVDREQALAVQRRVRGVRGVVAVCAQETKTEPAPLPYSLPDLQVDAGKRFALSPKQTLDACQALYETHRLLTYPRSDCSFLPEAQHGQAPAVLAAVGANVSALGPLIERADRSLRSRAWNDKKITAHHALIPTTVTRSLAGLAVPERRVYELVARRYLAQFLPPFSFSETKIEIEVTGERFVASGRRTIAEGWRVTCESASKQSEATSEDGDSEERQLLPALREGEAVSLGEVTISDRRTSPPKRFTEAGLIQAMTGIARFVEDPVIKKLLVETDGIGTPATQAQVIETLFERRFLDRQGRQIVSTEIGRALIQSLPDGATRPDMTALWEAAMRRIVDRKLVLPAFTGMVIQQLRGLVESGRARGALSVAGGATAVRGRPSPPARSRGPRSPARTTRR